MQIRIEKEEKLSGATWYNVWIGDRCEKCFIEADRWTKIEENGNSAAYNEALEFYNLLVQRQKEGYPRTEVIASFNTEDNVGATTT